MAQSQRNSVLTRLRIAFLAKDSGQVTDADLVGRFAARRDEAAFGALMERHGQLVLQVCRRVLHHDADADDAFQATFLVLARKAPSLRVGQSLAAWLYGVALRCARDLRKVAMRRRKHEERAASNRSLEAPAADAALHELQGLLDEEIERLPEKYRAPFLCCCLEGQSRGEAARALGWKEGTVSGRLARVREILQRRLVARGLTLSAALGAIALVLAASASVSASLTGKTTQAALAFAAGRRHNWPATGIPCESSS
jgi:RNA polymerase sigma factor (sigma-70 family)